jgi:hypothetical protein
VFRIQVHRIDLIIIMIRFDMFCAPHIALESARARLQEEAELPSGTELPMRNSRKQGSSGRIEIATMCAFSGIEGRALLGSRRLSLPPSESTAGGTEKNLVVIARKKIESCVCRAGAKEEMDKIVGGLSNVLLTFNRTWLVEPTKVSDVDQG